MTQTHSVDRGAAVDVFVRGYDGHIHTSWWREGSDWSGRGVVEAAGRQPASSSAVFGRVSPPPTISAYRGTWRRRLSFAAKRMGEPPSALDFEGVDARLVFAFFDHLENDRRNGVRSRNARLAAVHSLFRYVALGHREHAATIGRVLAMPPKRFERALVTFLTETEVEALLDAPDV